MWGDEEGGDDGDGGEDKEDCLGFHGAVSANAVTALGGRIGRGRYDSDVPLESFAFVALQPV